jgi:hypothetical protein
MQHQKCTARKDIFWAIAVSDFVNETARPYPKYYNLCYHNTMWIEQSTKDMFSLKPFFVYWYKIIYPQLNEI